MLVKWIRYLFTLAALALVTLCLTVGAMIIANNWPTTQPGKETLEQSLEAATEWLVENRETNLGVNNPILWYFLYRSAEISGDHRVRSIAAEYYDKNILPNEFNNFWSVAFDKRDSVAALDFDQLIQVNYYSQHFAYALSCDQAIGQLASIQEQNLPGFCGDLHFLKPTCTTHQLMGIRFLQLSGCGSQLEHEQTVKELQAMIAMEATLDPRILDVYIQRVMMLAESGNKEKIKNSWLHRILSMQLADGGWGNFQPLIKMPNGKYLGFGYGESKTGDPRAGTTFFRLVGIGNAQSTLHATAQGIYLLSLYLYAD